jgi:diguanylate cyclase
MGTSVGVWWRQPDHFEWVGGYLRARGMVGVSRFLISATTVSLVVIASILMVSQDGPYGTWPRVLGLACIAGTAGCAVLWVLRWPTKRQSIAFILVVNLCIAVFCQIQSNQSVGLVGCTAFAVTGGYIACFHSAGYLTYNFVVATYLGVLQAFRFATSTDWGLAGAGLLLVLVLNVAVPFGIQAVVYVLGVDVLQADRDPLTGLLNRRAFFDRVNDLVVAPPKMPCYLTISMVDLDRFKQLNDSLGHVTGDDALVAVGRTLRTITQEGAAIGRVGGEEFLVAVLLETSSPFAMPQQLCDAIGALPFPVTASIGTATARIDHLPVGRQAEVIHQLHRQADSAMYEAKRAGGNQVRQVHHPAP